MLSQIKNVRLKEVKGMKEVFWKYFISFNV